MTRHTGMIFWPLLSSLLLGSSLSQAQRLPRGSQVSPAKIGGTATATVFATDLRFPRGLKFGPDERLFVAESGLGGGDDTIGLCDQDPNFGPYHSGPTSRISSFDLQGKGTIVVDNLPSS